MSLVKILFVAFLVGFAGCASQAPLVKLRIAGGEKLTLDMSRGGIIGDENENAKVSLAGFRADGKSKKGFYVFAVEFKQKAMPRSVTVEDVTGEEPQLMVEDQSPKLSERLWQWTGTPLSPDDKALEWIREIDDSFRVYRVTVVLVDGRPIVLHYAAYFSSSLKLRMRRDLGLETP